jgi:hypothetical protein
VEVDRDIELRAAEPPREREVAGNPADAARALGDDDFVDGRVVRDDGPGARLDDIGQVRGWEMAPERVDGWRGEDHVADQPEPDEQDLQGSTVASSISITGMSSLIGYTR